MPDIVFEDVPGFNSTAALHTDQTIEKINEADAVIVIVDLLNNAQVTGELQNIFKNPHKKNLKIIISSFII